MEGGMKIKSMMEGFRSNPPMEIAGIKVKYIKDIQSSQMFEVGEQGKEISATIDLPTSNVLQFILDDGTKVSARPSGTEPKIKFYFSVKKDIDANISDSELNVVKDKASNQISKLEKAFSDLAQSS